MRVISLLICAVVSLGAGAEEVVWKLDLRERAARRADPNANTLRHAAWIAKGRLPHGHDDNVVDGGVDPTVLAPIELVEQVTSVFSLDSARQKTFRDQWEVQGAARILGENYWTELQNVLRPAIEIERENKRLRRGDDSGPCLARSEALVAARQQWGTETFDRFLYEVVAPGVYFHSSCSNPALMTKAEFWLDEWQWKERGCR